MHGVVIEASTGRARPLETALRESPTGFSWTKPSGDDGVAAN